MFLCSFISCKLAKRASGLIRFRFHFFSPMHYVFPSWGICLVVTLVSSYWWSLLRSIDLLVVAKWWYSIKSSSYVVGILQFSSVQSLSHVQLFVTPWTTAHQASLSLTNSWSLLKLMSIEWVMPSSHLILCHLFLLPPSIFPSIRVFSNESVVRIR